ncbi:MAG TPA: hypothetical protein PLA50_13420, partial [Bacteroidia bacterium]|nr:hypothetical protein [Bacteroidia bacterium]
METKPFLCLSALAMVLIAGGTPQATSAPVQDPVVLRTSVDRPLLLRGGPDPSVVVKIEVEGCEVPHR